MRLLFITQKIDQNDDDLAFTILWIKEFIKQGIDVTVICLERGDFDDSFPVYSLGKESGATIFQRVYRFLRLVTKLKYDQVFVHMNPEYFVLGGWWWALRGAPSYLWYTHYTMTPYLFTAGIFARYLFAATPQSLPQYNSSSKKVVLGHGIDTLFWGEQENRTKDLRNMVSVHRISRSKRLDLACKVLALLSPEYTLTVYGRAIDPEYYRELEELIQKLGIQSRVRFMGPVPMGKLIDVYPEFRLMLNLAPETIDKTMLEGMLAGVFPVTTPANSRAIGLPVSPVAEDSESIASFIREGEWSSVSTAGLRGIVEQRHSLSSLVTQLRTHMEVTS